MPIDKIKPPSHFPPHFVGCITRGFGKHLLHTGDKQTCKRESRRFRTFINSLKFYPMHHLHPIVKNTDIRSITRPFQTDPGTVATIGNEPLYQTHVFVNRKMDAELAQNKIFAGI